MGSWLREAHQTTSLVRSYFRASTNTTSKFSPTRSAASLLFCPCDTENPARHEALAGLQGFFLNRAEAVAGRYRHLQQCALAHPNPAESRGRPDTQYPGRREKKPGAQSRT